jgi:hypothetical protein
MNSKCCKKVVRKASHTIAIVSPLPKTIFFGFLMAWELLLLLLPKLLFLISAHCGHIAKLNNPMVTVVVAQHPSLSPSNLHVNIITCHPH